MAKTYRKDKAEVVASFYRYSDLSAEAIADQLDMGVSDVQEIIDELAKADALEMFVEQGTTRIEKVMTSDVACLDCSKTAFDAAVLMTERQIGSVVVTKDDGIPFGMVTERDIVRGVASKDVAFKDVKLEDLASHPLIVAEPGLTVEEAAEMMSKNKIRKLPVVGSGKLLGIVTVTDLATFLSPSRRPGLALSVLQAVSRGRT
jgi:CBS domain-containing protein